MLSQLRPEIKRGEASLPPAAASWFEYALKPARLLDLLGGEAEQGAGDGGCGAEPPAPLDLARTLMSKARPAAPSARAGKKRARPATRMVGDEEGYRAWVSSLAALCAVFSRQGPYALAAPRPRLDGRDSAGSLAVALVERVAQPAGGSDPASSEDAVGVAQRDAAVVALRALIEKRGGGSSDLPTWAKHEVTLSGKLGPSATFAARYALARAASGDDVRFLAGVAENVTKHAVLAGLVPRSSGPRAGGVASASTAPGSADGDNSDSDSDSDSSRRAKPANRVDPRVEIITSLATALRNGALRAPPPDGAAGTESDAPPDLAPFQAQLHVEIAEALLGIGHFPDALKMLRGATQWLRSGHEAAAAAAAAATTTTAGDKAPRLGASSPQRWLADTRWVRAATKICVADATARGMQIDEASSAAADQDRPPPEEPERVPGSAGAVSCNAGSMPRGASAEERCRARGAGRISRGLAPWPPSEVDLEDVNAAASCAASASASGSVRDTRIQAPGAQAQAPDAHRGDLWAAAWSLVPGPNRILAAADRAGTRSAMHAVAPRASAVTRGALEEAKFQRAHAAHAAHAAGPGGLGDGSGKEARVELPGGDNVAPCEVLRRIALVTKERSPASVRALLARSPAGAGRPRPWRFSAGAAGEGDPGAARVTEFPALFRLLATLAGLAGVPDADASGTGGHTLAILELAAVCRDAEVELGACVDKDGDDDAHDDARDDAAASAAAAAAADVAREDDATPRAAAVAAPLDMRAPGAVPGDFTLLSRVLRLIADSAKAHFGAQTPRSAFSRPRDVGGAGPTAAGGATGTHGPSSSKGSDTGARAAVDTLIVPLRTLLASLAGSARQRDVLESAILPPLARSPGAVTELAAIMLYASPAPGPRLAAVRPPASPDAPALPAAPPAAGLHRSARVSALAAVLAPLLRAEPSPLAPAAETEPLREAAWFAHTAAVRSIAGGRLCRSALTRGWARGPRWSGAELLAVRSVDGDLVRASFVAAADIAGTREWRRQQQQRQGQGQGQQRGEHPSASADIRTAQFRARHLAAARFLLASELVPAQLAIVARDRVLAPLGHHLAHAGMGELAAALQQWRRRRTRAIATPSAAAHPTSPANPDAPRRSATPAFADGDVDPVAEAYLLLDPGSHDPRAYSFLLEIPLLEAAVEAQLARGDAPLAAAARAALARPAVNEHNADTARVVAGGETYAALVAHAWDAVNAGLDALQ